MEPANTNIGTTGAGQTATGQSQQQHGKTNTGTTQGAQRPANQDAASFSGPANPTNQPAGYGKSKSD